MHVETLAFCVQCLEKANGSPMGIAIVNRICSIIEYESMEVFCNYKEIKTKLLKNEFKSPQEFLDYYDLCVEQIVNTFSPEAEISYGYLSLQEIMHNEMSKIIFDKKCNWSKAIQEFNDAINPIYNLVPNDKNAFTVLTQKSSTPLPEHKKKRSKAKTNDTSSTIDYLDLKEKISRLRNDEDVLEISKLVRRCEDGYILTENRSIEFDLSNFSQYALGLIKSALSNCEYLTDEEFKAQNQRYENAHKLQATAAKIQ